MENNKTIVAHTLTKDECYNRLETKDKGLSESVATKRLEKFGVNELEQGSKRTLLQKLIDQFKNLMILILVGAAIVSIVLNEIWDAVIIFIVVILNAVMGVMQESKAEKSLEALKDMTKPYAKVKREGYVKSIPAGKIVPGDIIFLEAGDFVPCDIRLTEESSLRIEESALTGESVPVDKNADEVYPEKTPVGDRKNMAYMGSAVVKGKGYGIAVKTGMDTQMGNIAGMLNKTTNEVTPLTKKLEELSKILTYAVLGVAVIIFIAGIMQGRKYEFMFMTSISLAVAAIPEGLPAVVTIVLAIGVQKMAAKNAIIRKLPAVETLGCTEIICSDKTGTLTQNKMTVKKLYINNEIIQTDENLKINNSLKIFLRTVILCNDTQVSYEDGKANLTGDPTETAYISLGMEYDYDKNEMEKQYERTDDIPFDSKRKLMTTVNTVEGTKYAHVKGAPDVLLKRCKYILIDEDIREINDNDRKNILKANSDFANESLRVLAAAFKEVKQEYEKENLEKDLIFIGLSGMIDPPREEVFDAVNTCRAAGMRPVMITGDHKSTAFAIGNKLGIIKDKKAAVTGSDIDEMTDVEFTNSVDSISVYARVSPEHKLRIIDAWKDKGKTVAMTGDGVNDAPALKSADIGVGMGITGTEVSKNASDMVLGDDNFSTIILAVKEGRRIYSNIRKCVQFLLSANMAEVVSLFIATMINWKFLFPVHILWINLVTDSLPALALGMEKSERDIMKEKPRDANQSLLSNGVGYSILIQGLLQGVVTLGTYWYALNKYNTKVAVTMVFVTLGLIQIFHIFNVRAEKSSIFKKRLFSNGYLIAAAIISAFLQVIVVLIPAVANIFHATVLTGIQWVEVVIASFIIIPLVEISKLIYSLKK